jgi:hypothetical protein
MKQLNIFRGDVMKKLFILLALASCGKKVSDRTNHTNYRQGYQIQRVQVGSPPEAISILNMSIRMGRLYDYQGARFYLFDGRYLFTSRVINQFSYELR